MWLLIITVSTVTVRILVQYWEKVGLGRQRSLTSDFKVMSGTEQHEYVLYNQILA